MNNAATNAEISKRIDQIMVQLTQVKSLLDTRVTAESKEAIRRAEQGLCTYCSEKLEPGERAFRGAHQRCYKRVNRAINAGTITDQQAINRGWVLVSDPGGSKVPDNDPIKVSQSTKRAKRPKGS